MPVHKLSVKLNFKYLGKSGNALTLIPVREGNTFMILFDGAFNIY